MDIVLLCICAAVCFSLFRCDVEYIVFTCDYHGHLFISDSTGVTLLFYIKHD